jgi:chromate reductase
MDVMNAPRLTIPNAFQQADKEGHLMLTTGARLLQKQAKAFVAFIRSRR